MKLNQAVLNFALFFSISLNVLNAQVPSTIYKNGTAFESHRQLQYVDVSTVPIVDLNLEVDFDALIRAEDELEAKIIMDCHASKILAMTDGLSCRTRCGISSNINRGCQIKFGMTDCSNPVIASVAWQSTKQQNILIKKILYCIFLITFFLIYKKNNYMTIKKLANIPRKILKNVCYANADAARNAAKNILLVAMSSIFIAGFSACKNDEQTPTPGNPSLIGTMWQLVAFVDTESGTSKTPDYDGKEVDEAKKDSTYLLYFYDDRFCISRGFKETYCTNPFGELYSISIDKLNLTFITTNFISYDTEEYLYYTGLQRAKSFSLNSDELRLYTNTTLSNKNYDCMLFKKVNYAWFADYAEETVQQIREVIESYEKE